MHTKEIKNLAELQKISLELVKGFTLPQLILLEGPLAVGKTQMVRYMAEALDCPKKDICSPTFSLINVYNNQKGNDIYHIDFYRIKKREDIESTSFWDIFYEPTIIFIEWPMLVKNNLPPLWNQLDIDLSFSNNSTSRILKWKQKNALSD